MRGCSDKRQFSDIYWDLEIRCSGMLHNACTFDQEGCYMPFWGLSEMDFHHFPSYSSQPRDDDHMGQPHEEWLLIRIYRGCDCLVNEESNHRNHHHISS